MVDLVPVEHDPFQPVLVPVDHDPFAMTADPATGMAYHSQPPIAPVPRGGLIDALTGLGGGERYQLFPERMVRSALNLPADVMSGAVPTPFNMPSGGAEDAYSMMSLVARAQDMAALTMLPGVAGRASAVIRGPRPWMEEAGGPASKAESTVTRRPQAITQDGATMPGEDAGSVAANNNIDAFHYTFDRNLERIQKTGLHEGQYATTNGSLSPLQAHIDLALPPNRGLPSTVVRVDLDALRKDGYAIPDVTPVARHYNMPGGGYEMQFPYPILPDYLKVIR
jgi:hypothetical protein